jgi:hypothetical protein
LATDIRIEMRLRDTFCIVVEERGMAMGILRALTKTL